MNAPMHPWLHTHAHLAMVSYAEYQGENGTTVGSDMLKSFASYGITEV